MATDIDVQYFSHLNGLVLGNNWGDLIRLLDKCLVNGLPLTSITSASIDAQGDITLNLYAAHNCMLFQIIELTGFTPNELNGKYRIKGTPSANQLILKAAHKGKAVTTAGTAKLASLGYDIIFRDNNDVKRVYRAKNPRAEHPFIRVDETISDGVNSYTSTYAKSAMVGLIEGMTHIDDYLDQNKLQLPLDTTDFAKNWKIAGTGSAVVRGWAKWYWAQTSGGWNTSAESNASISSAARVFTLCGDSEAFYFINATDIGQNSHILNGCGLFNTVDDSLVIPNWFLMAWENSATASATPNRPSVVGGSPLVEGGSNASRFFIPTNAPQARIATRGIAIPFLLSSASGMNGSYGASDVASIEVPFGDTAGYLRGSLKHVYYNSKVVSPATVTQIVSGKSMYIQARNSYSTSGNGSFNFYLGELE
ncbi:hypothetical protein [Acinetobacter bohemicus]|uniref:hypothetical protein n=1 Tax=Acinetobacter bohemicus TaxID=1435036 RepID=UPI00192B5B97|nr:hypothetical protein [Acinetobacter bohemicus]CAD9197559.1 hypothetical protein QAC21B_03735 [Acinetobacter bohemicus]